MLTRLILLIVIWLTACTPSRVQSPDSQLSKTEQPNTSSPTTSMTSDVQPSPAESENPTPREIVEKAKADLVKHFGMDADQIRVVDARAVNWPDASLGCPQPALEYVQVLTPGYWVLLEADNKQYPYHTDQAGQLILCLRDSSDSGTEISPLPLIPVNPTEIKDGQPWVPVD